VTPPYYPRSNSGDLRNRLIIAALGVGILAGCVWLTLVIVSRIDELFLPGQGLDVGVVGVLPGVDDQAGDQEPFNVLVLGLDRRPSEGDLPTRTDTLFVVRVDPLTKTASMLGVPRDLWVDIPYADESGYFQDRINTVYVTGESQGYDGGGVGLVTDVVEENFDIEIDHHVIIDFEGFKQLIDELGGIDVYVAEPVYDPYYSDTELLGDYYPIDLDVGVHHMDGKLALAYARTRFDASDLDRIQRQQRVIFAALDKATEQNYLRVDKLTSLWDDYKDTIDTDISDFQAPGFASLASQIDQDKIVALSIGHATFPFTGPQGQAALEWDRDLVAQVVSAFSSDNALLQEEAFVEIQNGAGSDGLAKVVADFLAGQGFARSSLRPAGPRDAVPLTEIIDYSGKEHTVARLASALGIPADRIRDASDDDASLRSTGADVLLILGADTDEGRFAAERETTGG
jgi:LCP family protein required for cell wall assembly